MRRLLIALVIFQGASLCWAQNARETHKTIEGYGIKVMLRDFHDVRSITAWDPETNKLRFEFPISQHAPPIHDIKFRSVDAGEHNQKQVALLEVEGLPLPFFDLGSGKPRFVKQDKTGRWFLSDPPEEPAVAWCLGGFSDCANIKPLTPNHQGLDSSVLKPEYRRLVTETDWAELRKIVRIAHTTPLPGYDVTRYMAVALFLGEAASDPQGHHAISATVVEHADHVVFYFTLGNFPGVISHPYYPPAEYAVFVLPRSTKRLILKDVGQDLGDPVLTVKEFGSLLP